MFQLFVRRRRPVVTLALLAAAVPASVAVAAGPVAAALPTCTRSTEIGGALLPAARNDNVDCLLRRGDRGDGAKRLQQTLVDCYDADLVRDGIFGPRTEAALKRAQSLARTPADGIYGPATRRAITFYYLGDSPCGRVR